MGIIDKLASHWKDYDYSFEGREVLSNGDEVWTYETLELGLPVLWLKHPDGSFEYRVIHTKDYDKPTGEHWCLDCHCQVERHDGIWICLNCGEEFYDEYVDLETAPSEEASYPDDLEPEDNWRDDYIYTNPYEPQTEYDFDGF